MAKSSTTCSAASRVWLGVWTMASRRTASRARVALAACVARERKYGAPVSGRQRQLVS